MLRTEIVIGVALALAIPAASFANNCSLTVRVPDADYPPYTVFNASGDLEGLSVDLTDAVMAEAGCDVTYKPLPWARGLVQLQEGDVDIVPHMSRTAEREEFAAFVGPMLIQRVKLIVAGDDEVNVDSLEDLKSLPYKVGIERGFFYGDEFESKRQTDENFANKLQVNSSVENNERMLAAGRISGFFAYELNVLQRASADPDYSNFVVHPFTLREDSEYYGFSRKSVDASTRQRVLDAFDRLSANGTLDGIRAKYLSN